MAFALAWGRQIGKKISANKRRGSEEYEEDEFEATKEKAEAADIEEYEYEEEEKAEAAEIEEYEYEEEGRAKRSAVEEYEYEEDEVAATKEKPETRTLEERVAQLEEQWKKAEESKHVSAVGLWQEKERKDSVQKKVKLDNLPVSILGTKASRERKCLKPAKVQFKENMMKEHCSQLKRRKKTGSS